MVGLPVSEKNGCWRFTSDICTGCRRVVVAGFLFHRNSVLNADFDQLELDDPVRFHEEAGEEGPQASTVHVERKVHAAG